MEKIQTTFGEFLDRLNEVVEILNAECGNKGLRELYELAEKEIQSIGWDLSECNIIMSWGCFYVNETKIKNIFAQLDPVYDGCECPERFKIKLYEEIPLNTRLVNLAQTIEHINCIMERASEKRADLMPIEEMTIDLFEKVLGLQYINVYVTDKYKIYIQGNIVIPKEAGDYLEEHKIPIMYELILNEKPDGIFDEAGIIAIKDGELHTCWIKIQ